MRNKVRGWRGRARACAAALILFVAVSQADANLMQLTFTGNASVLGYGDTSFTSAFVYDTQLGTLITSPTSVELDHGVVSAVLTLDGIGTFAGGTDDILILGSTYFQASSGLDNPFHRFYLTGPGVPLPFPLSLTTPFEGAISGEGTFQFGTCPSDFFPCGLLNASFVSLTDLSVPVPSPIAGAGLPGLVLACGGLLAWRRRRGRWPSLLPLEPCSP